MATSGETGSRGRRGAVVAAAAVALACAAAACAGGSHRAPAAVRAAPKRWCEARPNAAWRRVLAAGVLPLSRRLSLDPWALAHDGRSFFASIDARNGWSGVARIDVPTGRITHIRQFEHPRTDQADGAFDGRWLVWNEYHSLENFDDFTTWAWDSRTGAVTQIGAAQHAPDGSFWVSPWREPDVRAGIATWVQGSGAGGITAVHVYDLAQGRDFVAHTGHAQGSFLVAGPLVVWPESPARGAWTRMFAFDPASGREVAPPPALRTLRGVSGLYTDGRAIAFPSAKYKSLWVARSLTATPRLVVAAPGLNVIGNAVRVSGRYVGFDMQPRTFLGDATLGRYLQVSRGGWSRIDHTSLVLLHAIASKQWGTPAPIAFVPLSKLPRIPACRR